MPPKIKTLSYQGRGIWAQEPGEVMKSLPKFASRLCSLVALPPGAENSPANSCRFAQSAQTCCEVLVASPRVAENSPAKSSNPANENPAVPLRKILDLRVHACI